MTCRDAEQWMARAGDGTLAPDTQVLLDAHLASCLRCQAELDAQVAVRGLLMNRPPLDVSTGFTARVAAAVAAEARDDDGWLGLLEWRRWTLGLAPVAAGLLVTALLSTQWRAAATDASVVSASVTSQDAGVAGLLGGTSPASAGVRLLESGASSDSLVETMLLGSVSATKEVSRER